MRTIFDGARWVLEGQSATAATLQTLLTRVFILAISLATGVITARILEPIGRGEQAAISMWPQFLAYAMTLGLPASLLYNFKRHPKEESELFSAALLLSTGLGIVAMLTGIVFIPRWLTQYSAEVILFAQCFMVMAPVILLSETFMAALETIGKFTIANQVRYLQPLITLAILGVLALAQMLTPFTSALSYTLPSLPIFFWMLAYLWNQFHPHWRGLGTSYKRLISYGLRCYGMQLLGTLAAQLDQVLVIGLLTPVSMGLYVVALSVSRMLNLFQSSIITVLFPKVAARPIEEVAALTGRAARIGLALTLLAAIGLMALSPVLLPLLYGPDFIGAVRVFYILGVEVVISSTSQTLSQTFMASNRPGTLTILQAVAFGLSVPLMLVFIPAFGLEGAGLAVLCSTTARFILVLVSYPLILKIHPPGLLITREDWYFLLQAFQLKRG